MNLPRIIPRSAFRIPHPVQIIPRSMFHVPYSVPKRGALLLELLIAIAILAVILSVGSQAVYVSLQSGKTSGESDTAMGLASEALEQTRAVADEKWQNIYDLTKGSQYHFVQSGNKWATSTGSELITLNTGSFTRYVVVQNICRDTTVGVRDVTGITDTDGTATTCTTSTGAFDPSTQKVTVTVSWSGNGSPVTISDYFIRWRNKVCNQTGWSTGGSGTTVKTCPDTNYDTISPAGTIDTTGGTLKLQ
ncbi:MAG: hypothetical protein UY07_C0020G0006 [Parcubacteria group bacterium GW2011_GWA1_47_8]|nr:MAG: hypothetical protein UY07_C0020G0006 [Parcubacteria group bacterium GW2011_GWA1_47_8]